MATIIILVAVVTILHILAISSLIRLILKYKEAKEYTYLAMTVIGTIFYIALLWLWVYSVLGGISIKTTILTP